MVKFYWFLGHEQFQPEELVIHAKKVEEAGFDGVMISEHLQPWVDDSGAAGFAFSTLGAIAATTTKIELLTGVTTPLFRYHPAIIAQASATIDRLSKGRFSLGIGTGENINEGPLGVKFPNYAERSERIIEAIEIIKPLLKGETITFNGKYYQVSKLKLYSPPISNVPIFMAAGGPKSAITAAKYCDGVIISVKIIEESNINIISPIKSIKNNIKIISSSWSIDAKNNEDSWKALSAWRGLRAPSRSSSISPLELQAEADKLDKKVILSKYNLIKKTEDYIKIYSPLVTKLKSNIVVFQITSLNQLETIKKVGREVLPILRKL